MSIKKNILLTIRQGKIGGGETHVLQIVKHLDDTKFNVFVLSFTHGEMVNQLEKNNIPVFVVKTVKPFDITIWGKVKKLISTLKIDLIHAHGTRAMSNTFWIAKKLSIPIIYTVHGWSFHKGENILKYNFKVLLERFLTSSSKVTICVSKSNQEEGLSLFSLQNSIVIENGIDLIKFNPKKNYKNILEPLGIDTKITIVSYISRLTHQKDPFTMIKSFNYLKKSTSDIVLLVIGDGELRSACETLVKDLELENSVFFLGFRKDIPSYLYWSDIYCLPSLWEGLPIGLLEAMSMEKACIASIVNGTKEVIQPDVNGLTTPVKDPLVLSENILKLHHDNTLRKKIATNARRTVEENYSIERMIKKLERIYHNI
ncbi:glycosyltransferase family 4 protein [Tenacibaculum sp. nBUS_03]|uniref:glycosyltransferase family 4 protein n=1 Tax=Tenacibaculum sp. nBUS_03 TaxID=3395320 RepID=UPI003EBF0E19